MLTNMKGRATRSTVIIHGLGLKYREGLLVIVVNLIKGWGMGRLTS